MSDASMQEWERLPEALKVSNPEQARLGLHHADELGGGPDVQGIARAHSAKNRAYEPLEALARLEHGRWNVERLTASWRPGPRSAARKTSPYLVAWDELSEEIKDYDRATTNLMQLRAEHDPGDHLSA